MSDEITKKVARVDLPLRAVMREGTDPLYYVFEYLIGYGFSKVESERGYSHSTSAYARLGRIISAENQQRLQQVVNYVENAKIESTKLS